MNLKCDFHNHPLCHKYYPRQFNNIIKLDDDDKNKIEKFIDWCYYNRKLDVVAITDHDFIDSSLYAKEYVKKNNIPIKIITGAECEMYYLVDYHRFNLTKFEIIHLLILGIDKLPNYLTDVCYEDVEEFIIKIHKLGGIVIMAHPCFSKSSFWELANLLDGYEILNSDCNQFIEGIEFCKNNNIKLKTFKNSDSHFYDEQSLNYIPINYNEENEEFVNKLFIKD